MRELSIRVFRVIAILLILALFIPPGLAVPAAGKNDPKIQEAPVNPDFLAYEKGSKGDMITKINGKLKGLGYIPSPIDKSHLKGWKIKVNNGVVLAYAVNNQSSGSDIVSFQATFDLRTLGRVSPVKDQGSCCSCWAFATYGSLESNQLPTHLLDLSENNLKNTHGFDFGACSGGNAEFSAAYLTRWSGPVDEVADPFNVINSVSPEGLQPELHTQEIYYLPNRASATDNNNIKTTLQTFGGIYSTIYWTSSSFNSATQSYYYNGTYGSNHAITIVGWDDNYDSAKFTPAAPANGAFIAKNSWGSSWGVGGYFYISYYDAQIGKSNAVFTGEPTMNYDRIYQYDPLGWTTSFGYGTDTASFANVFTAAAGESLSAVSFYTAQINSNYQVSVYLDPTPGPINPVGPTTTISGTQALPGYHTIPLTTPVTLTSGQKFSIAVRLQTPGYNYPVPIEAPFSNYSSRAVASAGQSYISNSGTTWTDITSIYVNANVALKGFTKSGTQNPNPVPVLTSISPPSSTAGDASFTLTLSGSSFVPSSIARWNGSDRATTYVSTTQLTSVIPASDIASGGTASVTVFNPAPGGGTSSAVTFTINNPTPILRNITPSSTAAGDAAFTLEVNGTNFEEGSRVQWNGVDRTTSYLTHTLLNAQIPSSDIASTGTASVTVFNPVPGGGTSGALIFTIVAPTNPIPTISTISPSSTTAGGAGFTLTVTGTNFIPGSTVQWNGGNQATTYISSTRLTASVPAADIASAGTARVTVFTPSPGGGTSGSLTFTINALRLKGSFTGTPTTGPMPLTVVFTDTSTGNPTGWTWNFGDRTSSSLQNPTHIYRSAGSYTVTLTVSNNAGKNTYRKTNYIKVRRNQIILGNVP